MDSSRFNILAGRQAKCRSVRHWRDSEVLVFDVITRISVGARDVIDARGLCACDVGRPGKVDEGDIRYLDTVRLIPEDQSKRLAELTNILDVPGKVVPFLGFPLLCVIAVAKPAPWMSKLLKRIFLTFPQPPPFGRPALS